MARFRILIIEDDEKIAAALKEHLEASNYIASILTRGGKAVDTIRATEPDLVLLDIMLPDVNGISICREVRQFSRVPIIMITARVGVGDRLLGLEVGADDYICKPFIPKEVVARVKALLRRAYPDSEENKLVLGAIVMDEKKRQVTVGESDIKLTPIEYQLLRVMMCQPDHVFTRNDFISKIQGGNYKGYDRTIDNHIKNLRKKIKTHASGQEMIHTVYGIGYKISAEAID
jgi:two-component system response regulator BaeR